MGCNSKKKRGKLFSLTLGLFILGGLLLPVNAEEVQPDQVVQQEKTFLGINLVKEPKKENGKQLIQNKKSFLFINIVINGKCKLPKEAKNEVK